MAFPADPLGVMVELLVDGLLWTDYTADVRGAPDIEIIRGRSDQQQRVAASRCSLTFNDRTGKFRNRLPTSVNYGKLGHNTQIRVSVPAATYLSLPGFPLDRANTPDHASLDITGDLDVRIEVSLDYPVGAYLMGKYATSGDHRSWGFYVDGSGHLALAHSPDGTAAAELTATSTIPARIMVGKRIALRVTLDVDNGSSGHTVTFYTARTMDSTWRQLGEAVVVSGTTSVFASTAALEVGDVTDMSAAAPPLGKVFRAELRNGIGGSAVATPDFRTQASGGTTFADAAGRTWTVQGATFLFNRHYRFWGEIPEWRSGWDVTGTDVTRPIVASGIMRRLGQNAPALRSPVYREVMSVVNEPYRVAYWPCEDGNQSTQAATAVQGGRPMTAVGGVSFSSDDSIPGSASLPTFATGATMSGLIPPYTSTGVIAYRGLFVVPSTGLTVGTRLIDVAQAGGGTITRWVLTYATGGGLRLQGLDADGSAVEDSGDIAFDVDGLRQLIGFQVVQDGADVDWGIFTRSIAANNRVVEGGFDATFNSATVGRATQVVIGAGGGLDGVTAGHHAVGNDLALAATLERAIVGYAGETASDRIERLCGEEGIQVRIVDRETSARLGPQRVDRLLNLLHDAADADGGILFEPRDMLGIGYRSLRSLYNQDGLTLDYSAGHLGEVPGDIDDDQLLANHVIASRDNGSTVEALQTEGSLSVQRIGLSPLPLTVNVETDAQLTDVAHWALHVGTWDESRVPAVAVNLAREPFATSVGLTADVLETDLGDYLSIENPPAWLPPDPIEQIVQGTQERITNSRYGREWTQAWNTTPAGPYRVGVLDDTDLARRDTAGSELGVSYSSSATSLEVVTTRGPLWTVDDADYPFDWRIAGERIRVDDITPPASPTFQTGVADHDDNAAVTPALPASVLVLDVLFLLAAIRTLTATVDDVTDYVRLLDMGNVALFGRVAGSSESAPTVTFSGGAAGATTSARIVRFRGLKVTNIGNAVVAKRHILNVSAQDVTYPYLRVKPDHCLILVGGWKQDDWSGAAGLAGFSEVFDDASTTGDDHALVLDRAIQTTAEDVPSGAFTITGGAAAVSRGFVVAIHDDTQTATVTRSRNGVAKSQAAAAAVSLWTPARLGR